MGRQMGTVRFVTDKKTSMIVIFHDIEFMDGVCDKVYIISEGRLA